MCSDFTPKIADVCRYEHWRLLIAEDARNRVILNDGAASQVPEGYHLSLVPRAQRNQDALLVKVLVENNQAALRVN